MKNKGRFMHDPEWQREMGKRVHTFE